MAKPTFWSEGVQQLHAVLDNIEHITDKTAAEVQEALDTIRRMADALDEDNDTELPS